MGWGDDDELADNLKSLETKGVESVKTASGDTVRVERADGASELVAIKNWDELQLSEPLLKGVYAARFDKPFKIQEAALPLIIDGFASRTCLLAQAKSGSGKTAAFVLGMLHNVEVGLKKPQALCVCPTRELAQQNAKVTSDIGKVLIEQGLVEVALVVAEDRRQEASKRKAKIAAQIVIGTPGKCMDKIKKNLIDPSSISTFVLDEADDMDRSSLRDTTRELRRRLPEKCQVLCFSATYTQAGIVDIEESLFKRHKCDKIFVEEQSESSAATKQNEDHLVSMVSTILHVWCDSQERGKDSIVEDIFDLLSAQQAYIFVNTREHAFRLQKLLESKGFSTLVLTGGGGASNDGMTGEQRDASMRDFRNGKIKVMIATNVLSRGIDVPGANVVINYDLPVDYETKKADVETYVHRVGRTGRAGAKGVAINLVQGNSTTDMQILQELETTCFGSSVERWSKIKHVPDNDVEVIQDMAKKHLAESST